jgi:hypothetical protein
MRRSTILALSTAAVAGALLNPAAALAVTAHSSFPAHIHAHPGGSTQSGTDPDTITTFSVNSGALVLTVPATANLGNGAPGTTFSGALGPVEVTDNRALLNASWTTTVSSTDFTTGAGTAAETILSEALTYTPGTVTTTGGISVLTHAVALSPSSQAVVIASAGDGNNTASWNPNISVAVPTTAVTGTYTGTISESVS